MARTRTTEKIKIALINRYKSGESVEKEFNSIKRKLSKCEKIICVLKSIAK